MSVKDDKHVKLRFDPQRAIRAASHFKHMLFLDRDAYDSKALERIVDFMIQIEAMRDKISALKKDIKEEYGIPVATITKVATIVRKENLSEEEEKWEEIKEFVEAC